jgi:hypothetical protein
MPNKGLPFGSGRVVQSKGRRVPAVDDHHTFQAARDGWKLLRAGNSLRDEFIAAGDLNLMT